ncbi:MAG: hypothetical protein C4334_10740 [Pyrinomonas sp.]
MTIPPSVFDGSRPREKALALAPVNMIGHFRHATKFERRMASLVLAEATAGLASSEHVGA